jgi:UDP-N-acetylglucosamine:LPS N-acetylglucosamine transferase
MIVHQRHPQRRRHPSTLVEHPRKTGMIGLPPTAGPVVIVSASVGAGHDGAATELARQLGRAGWTVQTHDFLDLLPGRWGPMLRAAYRAELTVAPRTWGWLQHAAGGRRFGTRSALGLTRTAGDAMLAAIGPAPAAVVSTYPLASQVLGQLRSGGRLSAPVVTFLTDMSVHPQWVAAGVDAHLALHPVAARQARLLRAANTRVVGPAVAPAFRPLHSPAERDDARRMFGLPQHRPLALVSAGSWGVGSVVATAQDVVATGLATPVVMCGRNGGLQRRLSRMAKVIALGWVDDTATLMRASDLLIQNAGGLTCLEALATQLPVLTYRSLPGHGHQNAAALDEAGWAPWVRGGLAEAIQTARSTTPVKVVAIPDQSALAISAIIRTGTSGAASVVRLRPGV